MLYKLNIGPKPLVNTISVTESPANTPAGNLTAAAISDEAISDGTIDSLIGYRMDSISTLDTVNELLLERIKNI